MSIRRILSPVLTFLVIAGAWFFLAPSALPGGQDAYAEISGISMEPVFHRGDLVILRKASSYGVGDIAGYHNHTMNNLIVLHRIKAIDNGHYIFKGDNNDFTDPASLREPWVTQADLVGKEWVHIPRAGVALSWVRDRTHAALIALFAFVLLSGSFGVGRLLGHEQRPERPERPARGDAGEPAAPRGSLLPSSIPTEYLMLGVGALTAIFALLALISFSSASTRSVAVQGYYTETGTYSYCAKTKPGDVYPTGRACTGETIFERLAPRVAVRFVYKLTAQTPQIASKGVAGLALHLSGDNGYQRTLVLVPPHKFDTSTITLRSTLRLDKLAELLTKVENATDSGSGQTYRLQLLATVSQTGRVGTQQLTSSFAPALPLRFDKIRLYPDSPNTNPDGTPAVDYTQTQSGQGTKSAPSSVNLKLATLSIGTARVVGAVGALLGLGALAYLLTLMRRREAGDEPSRIAAEYGDWLVPVTHMTEQTMPYADVASFDALASLAGRADRAIMHYAFNGTHTYFVKEDDVVYRYTTTERTPQVAPLEAETEHREEPVSEQKPESARELDFEPERRESDAVELVESHAFPDAPLLDPLPPLPTAAPTPASAAAPASAAPAVPAAPLPTFEPIAPIEELPYVAPTLQPITPVVSLPTMTPPAAPTAPPAPARVPAQPAASAPVAPSAPTPSIAAGGFVPESPETAYQPAPVSMPPIVVPQQPAAPQPPAAAPSAPAVVPLAPIAPASTPVSVPDAALIRDTFLRPRPRPGETNGNGNGNGSDHNGA